MLQQQGVTQKVVANLPKYCKSLVWMAPKPALKGGLQFWFNNTLKRSVNNGELDFLANKVVKIYVTDMDFMFLVSLRHKKIHVSLHETLFDASVSAKYFDFLRLIIGTADPDTLFFRRRLALSGDTELALFLKNFLDTQQVSEHLPKPLLSLLTKLVQLAEHNDHAQAFTQNTSAHTLSR